MNGSTLMPPGDSRLVTRELLYTAVTRAKTKVRVVGRKPKCTALGRRVARQRAAAAPAVMAHVGLGCSGVSMIR
jgi:ATP-dependent exoDNAse (exonuclease V) alpha subunit